MEMTFKGKDGWCALYDETGKSISGGCLHHNSIMPGVEGFSKEETYMIMGFGTHQDYRNQGYGEKAVHAIHNYAISKGAKIIVLGVYENNPVAHRLYLRCGYVEYGRRGELIYMKYIL